MEGRERISKGDSRPVIESGREKGRVEASLEGGRGMACLQGVEINPNACTLLCATPYPVENISSEHNRHPPSPALSHATATHLVPFGADLCKQRVQAQPIQRSSRQYQVAHWGVVASGEGNGPHPLRLSPVYM